MAIAYKLRDPKTRKVRVKGLMGNVRGKHVMMPDDQGISLESLDEASKMAMDNGALSVTGFVTHGILAEKEGIRAEDRLRNSPMSKLYMTDTIPRSDEYLAANPKIEVVSCVDLFSNAIKGIHENKSISKLFQ